MRIFTVVFCLSILTAHSFSQRVYPRERQIHFSEKQKPADFKYIPKKPGHYTAEEWRAAIDSTWGPGLPNEQKLAIFDEAWNTINADFPCFQNLDVDWPGLHDLYRPEIEAGVSQGRFAAIMNIMSMALQEGHTFIDNKNVNWNTPVVPGVPLFNLIGHKNNSHFGACLTTLPDSTIFVYKAVPDHPLGLQPGDIIVGYDGIPWKELYKELLEAQLPYHFEGYGGSTQSWWTQLFLGSAGLNWHLYDTLDVIKYGTSDTVHYPTALLAGQTTPIWDSDQLPVPGVPFWFDGSLNVTHPVGYPTNYFSWGYVENTNIAYIYIAVLYPPWQTDIISRFSNAVNNIMNNDSTIGLILDIRLNYGGQFTASNPALSLLFNEELYTVAFDKRCGDPDNHFQMCPTGLTSDYMKIPGNQSSFFNKPIAVLIGPGCLSAGDQLALRMKLHPMARLFGRPTNGAFSANADLQNLAGNSNWVLNTIEGNSYRVGEPGKYLTHIGFIPDEEVWLTPDDVARGEDTVVKRAIEWIQSVVEVVYTKPYLPNKFVLQQNYPNPFNPSTKITFTMPKPEQATLAIYSTLGQKVATLLDRKMNAGSHDVRFNASDLPSGIYFYRIQAGEFSQVKKMVLLR